MPRGHPLSNAEKQQRYRNKIKADPVKHEIALAKVVINAVNRRR